MDILRCTNLTKTYGQGQGIITALDHVSLSLERGSFTAVVGASGSGKSTLLHLLGGVDRPTEGSIYIEDTDISTLTLEQLAIFRRRKVGLVYQFYNLIPTLNVRKNILLPVLLDGEKPDEARFEKLVATLGLSDRLTHYPRELSGGQQQRAAIARALASKPSIILADEPTGNLDSKTSSDVIGLLKMTSEKFRQTIVMITHNPEIAQMADCVVRIEDGKIVEG